MDLTDIYTCPICLGIYPECKCKPSAAPAGLRLIKEQAVTLSQQGRHILIDCDTYQDAEELYHWLESLSNTKVKARP